MGASEYGKACTVVASPFLNRNKDSLGLVVLQNRHALKNITFISSKTSYWREIWSQVLSSPKQRPSARQQGCSQAATEEADEETHSSGLQAWRQAGRQLPLHSAPAQDESSDHSKPELSACLTCDRNICISFSLGPGKHLTQLMSFDLCVWETICFLW